MIFLILNDMFDLISNSFFKPFFNDSDDIVDMIVEPHRMPHAMDNHCCFILAWTNFF